MISVSNRSMDSDHELSAPTYEFYERLIRAEYNPQNIDLSNGDPHCLPPASIKKIYTDIISHILCDQAENNCNVLLHKYWRVPHIAQELLEAGIQHFLKNGLPLTQSPTEKNPTRHQVTVGMGVTQLLAGAIHVLTNPGEGVVTCSPHYGL